MASPRAKIAGIASVVVVAAIVITGFLVMVPVTSFTSIPFTVTSTSTVATSYYTETIPYVISTATVVTSTSGNATYVSTIEQTFSTASFLVLGRLEIHISIYTSTSAGTKTCQFAFWRWLVGRPLTCQ